MDQCCLQGTHSNLAKNYSQSSSTKDSSDKDLKAKESQPSNNSAKSIDSSKKTWKDKNQKMHWDRQEKKNNENSISYRANAASTGPNLFNHGLKKQYKGHVSYYNYGKKSYYSGNCLELGKIEKNSSSLGNFDLDDWS